MGTTQRIPLRILTEQTNGGLFTPQSGNTAGAPSIGRPSAGSPVSAQINSFLVANDCLTIDAGAFFSAGVTNTTVATVQFPNIPQTQNNSTNPQPVTGVGNQVFPFTAPASTLLEYYTWCSMASPVQALAGGGAQPALVMPWVLGYATDATGIQYRTSIPLTGGSQQTGQNRLPSGIAFQSFNVTIGYSLYLASGSNVGLNFVIKVFGELILTYPSANSS